MKDQTYNKGRRSTLKGLISIPILAVAGFKSTTSYAAMVAIDDPTAIALAYTEKSTTAGQLCSNCLLYQGGAAASGACPIFAGKEVAAAGWCSSWVAKA